MRCRRGRGNQPTGRAVLLPRRWAATIKKTCGVHPALLEGAEAAFALTTTRPRAANMPLWAFVVPRSDVGEWRALHRMTRARAGRVVLVTPRIQAGWPELLRLEGRADESAAKNKQAPVGGQAPDGVVNQRLQSCPRCPRVSIRAQKGVGAVIHVA